MHRDRDFDLEADLPPNEAALRQDLELETLWAAMAGGDKFLHEIARRAVLLSLRDPDAIRYRQQILADCLDQREVVTRIYGLAIEAIQAERTVGWLWAIDSPERILHRSVETLKLHVDILRRLRQIAEEDAGAFRSEGFARFFAMAREELTEDYLTTVAGALGELELKRGLVQSAELGKGAKGRRYVVRRPRERSWTDRLTLGGRPERHSFQIPARDEAGFKALEAIRARGLNQIADVLAQSCDHVKAFFGSLRAELGFYLGCMNLRERLDRRGEPACFPVPLPAGRAALSARGLYDVCLALHVGERIVGNDVDAEGLSLLVLTGANRGGKSTFLRALGLAQLMMQSGMFVGAEAFQADVCAGVFTHYRREEDAAMEGGKLDEELARMSEIADHITRDCLLLLNESFASTNEREGSEIARQVVRAMLDRRIKVCLVTHMYDLAHGFHAEGLDDALFLRAERLPDGRRTFRLGPGEPLPTSHGEDLYERIFGPASSVPTHAGPTPR